MRYRTTLTVTLIASTSACYSPNMEVTSVTSPGPTSSDGDDETLTDTSGSGSAESSTDNSASATSATTTSDVTTATTADATGETSTGSESDTVVDDSSSSGDPPEPFCGDGNVDRGEDCDDGEANALTGACRPDCTEARCGDGDVWDGGEACDDGDNNNVLEIGACAPDCSRVIEERLIVTGAGPDTADLGNNPVVFMDGHCDQGFLAMFAYPGLREAALSNFDTSDSIDWVLAPYTAYVREDGTLIWITDSVPLLGVRDGQQEPLVNSVLLSCENNCIAITTLTGLAPGWTTDTDGTCDLWTSANPDEQVFVGNARSDIEFLRDPDFVNVNCGFEAVISPAPYCVEQ